MKDEGGETELIHLNKLKLEPCIACDKGWGKCRDEGVCILEDDFQNLTEKIVKSDALVFATPVYWHDLSESAKIFLDRLRRCEVSTGFKTFAGKKAIGIVSAGGSGRGAVRALFNLEDYLRRLGFDYEKILERVCSVFDLEKDYIIGRGRQKDRVEARDLLCYWSAMELGISMANLAKKLGMTISAVSYAVQRGEKIAKENGYQVEN